MLPCCCIHASLYFDMQHDRVLIKLDFDILTPIQESGVGPSVGKIFAIMLLHS